MLMMMLLLRLTHRANSVCFYEVDKVLLWKHRTNTSLFLISTPLPALPQATPYILIIMSSSLTPDLWWTWLYVILLEAGMSPPHLFIYSDSIICFYIWQVSLIIIDNHLSVPAFLWCFSCWCQHSPHTKKLFHTDFKLMLLPVSFLVYFPLYCYLNCASY